MLRYLARRLAAAVLILFGITLITYALTYLIPVDPARLIAGRNAKPEIIEQIRAQLGLDRPLVEQYAGYISRLVQGDFGRSYAQKTQVAELIASRLPATLLLLASTIVLELLIGLPAGITAAVNRGRRVDRAVMMFSFVGVSAPHFVVGLLLLYVFAYQFDLFPMAGFGTLGHVVLPALTLAFATSGWYSRMIRSSMVDVLRQDYVRTARAKGVGERGVVLVHALRNAILPIVAMVGLDIGIFMSGAVVVESVFGWPGIGQLAWQAIQRVDIPIIMAVTLVAAVGVVVGNLLADVIAPLIDPRIRLR